MTVAKGWKGISLDVLEAAGVETHGSLVTVPYRDTGGRDLYRKCFTADGRSFYRPAGIDLVPFGLETLPPRGSRFPYYCALLVCEGEKDALAARDVLGAVEDARAVRYLALGLPGAGAWKDEWRRFLEPFPLIYVLGDGDAAGQKMNSGVSGAVPWARPVSLTASEDVRSLLQGDAGALFPFLDRADWYAETYAAIVLPATLDGCRRLLMSEEAAA